MGKILGKCKKTIEYMVASYTATLNLPSMSKSTCIINKNTIKNDKNINFHEFIYMWTSKLNEINVISKW